MSPLLTKPEAAARLRCSLRTIQNMARRGDIPYYRPHRKLLFDPQDIDRFLERTKVNAR